MTPVRIFVWAIFLGTADQVFAQRLIEDFRMRMRQADLRDHIVICGFGPGGRAAAGELVRRGEDPCRIVVVDTSEVVLLGATATICPSTVSGILLANSISSSRTAAYVYDMLTVDGRVLLDEQTGRPSQKPTRRSPRCMRVAPDVVLRRQL